MYQGIIDVKENTNIKEKIEIIHFLRRHVMQYILIENVLR
jgi:hypothetical protein